MKFKYLPLRRYFAHVFHENERNGIFVARVKCCLGKKVSNYFLKMYISPNKLMFEDRMNIKI